MELNLNLTSYDKLIPAIGAMVVGICLAAGVDVSGLVQALVGLALIAVPFLVHIIKNKGLTYTVASKFLVAAPAAIAGVFLLFNIDVSDQLEQVSQSILTFLPFVVAGVGNSAAVVDG